MSELAGRALAAGRGAAAGRDCAVRVARLWRVRVRPSAAIFFGVCGSERLRTARVVNSVSSSADALGL